VITDPKLLIAGVCLFALTLLLALIMRQIRRHRDESEPSASAGSAINQPAPMSPIAMHAIGTQHGVQPTQAIGMPRPSYPAAPVATDSNGRKIISIVHDFGHPRDYPSDERRYLSTREAFEILAEIRSMPADKPIDIILHTPGGEAFACELIASAIKDRPNTTTYVPYCAMSAGTIIALATEKIVMGKYACLGPIDTQFFGFPIESYIRLLKEKPMGSIEDFTVLLGYLAEKEMKTARARACELLNKKHFGQDDACALTDFLVAGNMPHSEQIDRNRAIQLGVNIVDGECPASVYEMVEQRLKIYKSMDGQDGYGPDYKAQSAEKIDNIGAARLEDRRGIFMSPPTMWRKP
jgi:hypothetical protein